ncbi:hypothetical protein EL18_01404 [Nitratireductor basaltis]|uniref:Uncharacterized protein n=1 Tax=Nitratireductor basaltis TaxID=472175 RepID=A0A084UBN7_9HYPH|nr:hypothetical protein EL18_01404 [Nitratireductor basaltis]
MLAYAFMLNLVSHVDSRLESTRVFWRQKYFNATDEEARDPRPWAEVFAERPSNEELQP